MRTQEFFIKEAPYPRLWWLMFWFHDNFDGHTVEESNFGWNISKRTLYSHHFGEQKISLPFPEPSPPKKKSRLRTHQSPPWISLKASGLLRPVKRHESTSCHVPPLHDTKAVIAGTLHEVPSKNAYWWTRMAATNPTQVVFMPGLERKSLENGEFNKHLFSQHNFFDHFWFSSRF